MAYIGKQPAVAALTASDITDGIVSTAKIADTAITNAKLNADIISADTALGATPADTDELLVSDAGVLKRMDYSYIKGATIGHSSVYMTSDTAISGDGNLTANLTIYLASAAGTGIIDDISSGEIRVDKTGFYLAIWQCTGNITSGDDSFNHYIATTDGTTISRRGYGYTHIEESDEDQFTTTIHAIVDVDNVSNVKFLMRFQGANNITLYGTGQSVTSLTLIRLGDT